MTVYVLHFDPSFRMTAKAAFHQNRSADLNWIVGVVREKLQPCLVCELPPFEYRCHRSGFGSVFEGFTQMRGNSRKIVRHRRKEMAKKHKIGNTCLLFIFWSVHLVIPFVCFHRPETYFKAFQNSLTRCSVIWVHEWQKSCWLKLIQHTRKACEFLSRFLLEDCQFSFVSRPFIDYILYVLPHNVEITQNRCNQILEELFCFSLLPVRNLLVFSGLVIHCVDRGRGCKSCEPSTQSTYPVQECYARPIHPQHPIRKKKTNTCRGIKRNRKGIQKIVPVTFLHVPAHSTAWLQVGVCA